MEKLGCSIGDSHCSPEYVADTNTPNWVYSTRYWIGSAGDSNHLWYVESNGFLSFYGMDYTNSESYGIRPVITISTDDLK